MDSVQAIPLPSLGSSSNAIPKLRISRWATNNTNHNHSRKSEGSATGSATIPVHSRGEIGLSEDMLSIEAGEELAGYPLSSEGEPEVASEVENRQEEPAIRLRNIMDQIRSHPFMSSNSPSTLKNADESPTRGKSSSPLPSVRDSDLESITPSVLAGHSAKDRLRDTWSQAMIPPVGNTPRKVRSKVLARRKSLEGMGGGSSLQTDRRKSLSDEDVSTSTIPPRPISRAESLDLLKRELDSSMLRSAMERSRSNPAPSDLSLFDHTPQSLRSDDFVQTSTPPARSSQQSSSSQLQNYVDNAMSSRKWKGKSRTEMEDTESETPEDSHLEHTKSRIPTTKPFHHSRPPSQKLESITLVDSESPQKSRLELPATRPKLVISRSPHSAPGHERTRSDPSTRDSHAKDQNSPNRLRPPSRMSIHHPRRQESSLERPHTPSTERPHTPGSSASRLQPRTPATFRRNNSPPRSARQEREGDTDTESLATSHRSVPPASFEQSVEENHERERNWNSPRPHWHNHHHEHENSPGDSHEVHYGKDEYAEDGKLSSSAPAAHVHRTYSEPTRPNSRSNQSLLKTPKVPGSWTPTPNGRASPVTPGPNAEVSKNPATPYPPGGWNGANTPLSFGRKGILKVRFDSHHEEPRAQELDVIASVESDNTRNGTTGDLVSQCSPPASTSMPTNHPPVPSAVTTEPRVEPEPDDSGSDTDVPPFRSVTTRSKIRLVDASGDEVKSLPPTTKVEPPIAAVHPDSDPQVSGLPVGPITLVSRLRNKLADIRSEFPPSPNQSGVSFSVDSANNTEDERLAGEIITSRKERENLAKRMETLQSGDDDLAQKLSKLRQSFLDSGAMARPQRSRVTKWTLTNLKIIFIVEALLLLTIILFLSALHQRTNEKFMTIYYDPFFPALYTHPRASILASAASRGSFISGLSSYQNWDRGNIKWVHMPWTLCNYVMQQFGIRCGRDRTLASASDTVWRTPI